MWTKLYQEVKPRFGKNPTHRRQVTHKNPNIPSFDCIHPNDTPVQSSSRCKKWSWNVGNRAIPKEQGRLRQAINSQKCDACKDAIPRSYQVVIHHLGELLHSCSHSSSHFQRPMFAQIIVLCVVNFNCRLFRRSFPHLWFFLDFGPSGGIIRIRPE